MDEIEKIKPEQFEHQIVVTSSGDCKCGKHHHEGDAVWGGVIAPDSIDGQDMVAKVESLHSVPTEIRQS